MRYFPMRPPIVSLSLYSDSRTQGWEDTSWIPKDKEEQLGGRKGKKRREEEKKERDEVFLDWFKLFNPLKEMGLSGANSTPPLLKKQRGYSQRLPWFLMPTETGKGYLSGNLCGFKLQSTEAIKKNVYEAFIDYLMSLLVWFFMGEEKKKVKVKRNEEL